MCTCNPNTQEVEEFNTSLGCPVGMMLAWATGDQLSQKQQNKVPSRKQLKQQQKGQLESLC